MKAFKPLAALATLTLAVAASSASAALSQSQIYTGSPVTYNNGAGSGFSGAVGAGAVTFNVVGSDLVISFAGGGALNDLATVFLDTRAGGFTDAQMSDTSDGGRRASTNLTVDGNDVFPILPDFTAIFANFGAVTFELTNTASINFLSFGAAVASVPPPISIPLATLGNPSQIDFFVAYVSDSGFTSNETLPADPAINGAGNPGFGTVGTDVVFSNFNRLVLAVPEPSAMSLLALPALALTARRRRISN